MKNYLSNPLALIVTGMVLLIVAAIDVQFVNATPENWFRVLHWYGQVAVILFMAILIWAMFRYMLVPAIVWVLHKLFNL